MKAIWDNVVMADGSKEELICIEGNWYFLPSNLMQGFFILSDHKTMCTWKGRNLYGIF